MHHKMVWQYHDIARLKSGETIACPMSFTPAMVVDILGHDGSDSLLVSMPQHC